MNKRIVILTVFMLLGCLVHSYGFMETRLQWWQVRLAKLEAERTKLHAADPGSPIIGIIDKDAGRARAIIDVFEREMKHDGSLTHATRVMTDADIAAEARTVVPPLCALRQLEIMVRDPYGEDALAATRDAAERRIKELSLRYFGAAGEGLARRIIKEDIAAAEWKALAMEVRAGSVIAGRARFEEEAQKSVAAAVAARIGEQNGTANGRELRTITIGAAREYLDGCGAPDRRHDDGALAASWTWMRREAFIERDFAGYRKILSLAGIPAGTPLEQVRRYHRTPADLEPVLFGTNELHNANEHIPSPAPPGGTGGSSALEIPALPAVLPLLEEMGRIRRAALLTVTGREDAAYLNELDARLGALIERGTENATSIFAREGEKARLIREQEGPGARILNEREFNDARRLFNGRLSSLGQCRSMTVAVVGIALEGKKMTGGEVTARYRSLLRRSGEYLGFARELTAAGARASSFCGPQEQKRFGLCMSGTSALFRTVGAALAIDRNDRPFLSKGEIGELRALTAEFAGSMQAMRDGVRRSAADFGRARSTAAGAELKGAAGLREKIAQDDIDAQREHAAGCTALYRQFGYGEEMLSRYAERYASFLKEARAGAVTPALENAAADSILASLGGFDGDRIRRELAAKRYLKSEAKAALARLRTLLQYYRKHNVRVPDAPVPEEIAVIEKSLAAAPQARIDTWTMNETNMAEIDGKASRRLTLMLGRKIPPRNGKAGGDAVRGAENRRTVTIREPDLSFAVPARWAEETVGQAEAYRGVVKSFSTGEGGPSVKLVRLPMEDDDMKDAAEQWVRQSGCVLIEKRWEKGPETDCFWIIAKDGDRNISETCSVSRNGFTVLITGKASRERYPGFRASLRKIVDSMR